MLYPIMTESRFLSDLGGIWKFKPDDGKGFTERWYERPLTGAMNVPVPSSYNDLFEDAKIRDHYGWVFYQRSFGLPSFVRGERTVLRMDAVTHHARVYLNGQEITEHRGGFLPFEAEIGEVLVPGENLLTIAVDNRVDYTTLPVGGKSEMLGGVTMGVSVASARPCNKPNFDFFNYCGITRPVRIYTTPESYIRDITLTSEISGPDAQVHYQVDAVAAHDIAMGAAAGADGDSRCHVRLLDRTGKAVAEADGLSGTLSVKNVQLWQPMKAYLYQVEVRFETDIYELPYGIRSIRIEGKNFLINGKPFYFKGYGKHEDTFPNGRGLNMPMNVKDISIMKWQGANSFRTSHYPYSEEMMRLCDEEGIVVIDETTAVGVNLKFGGGANEKGERTETFDPVNGVKTQAHHKEVIRDLIARDKNHACVVIWSIANEPDSSAEGAYEYFAPLFALARELDPEKRPCTLVSVMMPDAPAKDCTSRLSDVFCLNRYYGWYVGGGDLEASEAALRHEMDGWEVKGRPVIFTEYGADTVMGLHDTTPVMFTEEYQVDYYKMNNRVFDDYPCVAGEQTWNFADFATSQGIMRVQGNKKGMFTRDRKPKLAAHYFRERWHQIPDFGYKNGNSR